MTRDEEKQDAYALRDELVTYVDKYAQHDNANVPIAAALGLVIEMGARKGMSEIQVAELLLNAAISGLPMNEQIAYRLAHGYTSE